MQCILRSQPSPSAGPPTRRERRAEQQLVTGFLALLALVERSPLRSWSTRTRSRVPLQRCARSLRLVSRPRASWPSCSSPQRQPARPDSTRARRGEPAVLLLGGAPTEMEHGCGAELRGRAGGREPACTSPNLAEWSSVAGRHGLREDLFWCVPAPLEAPLTRPHAHGTRSPRLQLVRRRRR